MKKKLRIKGKSKIDKKNHNSNKTKLGFKSIRVKMIGSFALPVFFVILVGIVSYTMASNAIIKNYRISSTQSLSMTSKYLEYGFKTVETTAVDYLVDDEIKQYLTGQYESDRNVHTQFYTTKKQELITKATSDLFISNIYLFSDPVYSISTNKKSTLNMYSQYKDTEQGKTVYQNAEKYHWLGQSSFIDETIDIDTNSYAMRVIKPFYDIDAFLVIDVDKQAITDILNKLALGKGSYVSFITADGIEMMQDGTKKANISKADFYDSIKNSDKASGYKEQVTFGGKSYMFLYNKIGETGAVICALIPTTTIVGKVASIKLITIIAVILASLTATLVGGLIALSMDKSIRYINDKLSIATTGDLTVHLKLKRRDEFMILANHVNEMLESVSRLIKDVKLVNNRVSESTNAVTNSSMGIFESSTHISDAIGEIEKGLTQQANDTMECVNKMDELSDQIGIVETETNEIRNITDSTSVSITESLNRMIVLEGKAKETSDITKNILVTIEDLKEKTESIDKIIEVINGIADSTTLLALNASIEAARAGEAGKGFTVVANEIKKLAEQSITSTNEIRVIVNEIDQSSDAAVLAAKEAEGIITLQEDAVQKTKYAFHDMKDQVENLINKLVSIVGSINNMDKNKAETLEQIENISTVTEEIVASISMVGSKTQSQVMTANDLSSLAEEMNQQIINLNEAIKKFNV